METTLALSAVKLAIEGKWKEAIEINLEILKEDSLDIDALNRLARAYKETGNIKKARDTAEKVLRIEPNNSIAIKCLQKYKSNTETLNKKISSESFLEESGKTKLINLINLGNKNILNSLSTGDALNIIAYSHKVSITTQSKKYIGCLPDDLSKRLNQLIKSGAKYNVLVKSVTGSSVMVFIRELSNTSKTMSFSPEKMDYVTFTPPELVHKDDVAISSEEEID